MSLFTDRPEMGQGPSAFVVSILVHGAIVGAVSLAFIHVPVVRDPEIVKRYAVRHLDLHMKLPVSSPSGGAAGKRAGAQSRASALQPDNLLEQQPSASWQIPQFTAALQTLVQPDLPPNLSLAKKIPIPTVVIWKPQKQPVKAIVPPPPQAAASADVQPSLDAPSEEPLLADVAIAASDFTVPLPLLNAGTTSPVAMQGLDETQAAPSIASESAAQPAPAAALALSDLRMTEGTVTLPPANQTSPGSSPATQAPGLSADSSQTGNSEHGSKSGDAASAQSQGDQQKTSVAAYSAEAMSGAASGTTLGAGSGDQPATDRITLSKNGQFGVVVVGSSLDEEYPDLLQIWGGRVAYTVYLQVGKSKNWVLQYSLPRQANTAADTSGAGLEAPWPYDIIAPHIIPVLLNADAMVLHGLVTSAGRFDSMTLVYPARAPQGTLVLNALAQWQFRPAMLNGSATAVEVVLVIPNQPQ